MLNKTGRGFSELCTLGISNLFIPKKLVCVCQNYGFDWDIL